MQTLKPCPFCGGKASIERKGDRRMSTIYSCDWCGCSLETGEEWDHGKAWNTRPMPAATDTGLVTVGYVTPEWLAKHCVSHTIIAKPSPAWSEAVVTRSQAEELLAAERAEANHQFRERVKEWERANALEAKLASAKSTIESMVYVYEVNLNNHNDGEDYDIYVEACDFIGRRPQL